MKHCLIILFHFLIFSYSWAQEKIVSKLTLEDAIVDENNLIKIKGTVQNEDYTIIDGMNVNIRIKKKVSNKLFIPRESIILRDDQKIVFTYENGKAIWNNVTTSYENSTHIVIEEGLKKDSKVIISGNTNLAHNTDVIEEKE